MISKILRGIIVGAPGSGKGTISNRIIKDFDMKYVASGDLLRSHIINKTEYGVTAQKYIEKGKLVPDDLVVKLILQELEVLKSQSWLMDGFPRTVSQAESLLEKVNVDTVLNLKIPHHIIMDRIKGRWTHLPSGRIYNTEFNPPKIEGKDDVTGEPLVQRDDDKPETVKRRLDEFHEITEPVLDFFRAEGIVEDFTGKYSNEIWPLVHKYLSTRKEPSQYTKYG